MSPTTIGQNKVLYTLTEDPNMTLTVKVKVTVQLDLRTEIRTLHHIPNDAATKPSSLANYGCGL